MTKHFIHNRSFELVIGLVFFVVGSFLLWDAFDNRGKQLIWPLSAIFPW